MSFDLEKMLQDIDDVSAPPKPVLPYEVTSMQMKDRWSCSRATAFRRLNEDTLKGKYLTREAKMGKSIVRVWWRPEWKEAWEASQQESL